MHNESSASIRTGGALAASRYRVSFIAKEALDLPFYLGSTLRGAFGHAFRKVACPALHGACPVPAQCPYHLIFETSPPPGSEALRTHVEIPRPFVIAPAAIQAQLMDQPGRQQFNPGDEVSFELILIGRAQEFFPHFVVALREVDRIGRGRRIVELHRIEALPAYIGEVHIVHDAETVIPPPGQGTLGGAQRSRAKESATCANQKEVRRESHGSATSSLARAYSN